LDVASPPTGARPEPGSRTRTWVALAVALAYLLPALFCLDDYGPAYDPIKGDYPYGERLLGYLESGDERFLDLALRAPAPELRAPHPDFDVERFPVHWAFPVGGLLSAVSCRVLWTELGILPAMSAHCLPIVLLAAMLVFVVSLFASARFGWLAGVVAGGALFLTPSFFGHSFNNPRDLPECVFYTLAVLGGLRALESGSLAAWLGAGAMTGLALAQKANALFLPVQLLLFVGGLLAWTLVAGGRAPRPTLRGLLVCALGFVLAYYTASPAFWSAPIEGPRGWVLEMVRNGNRGLRADASRATVSFEALVKVLWTVPLPILALALLGALRPGIPFALRWFLLVGAGLPIARHFLPGMRTFDGTRHYLEFLPMTCLLAGAGAAWLGETLGELLRRRLSWRAPALASGLVATAALALPAWAVIDTHPNEVVYFNALAGGLGTQQARGNIEACDFWGNSYWQGLDWLNRNAEQGAGFFVPAKEFIARAGAPVRLAPGLHLVRASAAGPKDLPLYALHLVNRWNLAFQVQLDRDDPPVHEIRVQNGSVLHVHRLERDERGQALMETWRGELQRLAKRSQVVAFLGRDKEKKRQVIEVIRARLGPEETLARLRALLPAELHDVLADLLGDPEELEAGLR
jgi:dolichyl-phosphate-mannose-protein mannosyltransferase